MRKARNFIGSYTENSLPDYYESSTLELATCWKLTPVSGASIGATSHTKDLTLSEHPGVVFRSAQGIVPTATESEVGLTSSGLEIDSILSVTGVSEEEIAAGDWDNAFFEVFVINYRVPEMGELVMFAGHIGELRTFGHRFRAEGRPLTAKSTQEIGNTFTPKCRVKKLGDVQCKVNLNAPAAGDGGVITVTGVVTTGGSNLEFIDFSRPQSTGYFTFGTLTFTTGDLAGRSAEIKEYVTGGIFRLNTALPRIIDAGDEYVAVRGCDREYLTCKNVYDNLDNIRAFPFVPGLEKSIRHKPTIQGGTGGVVVVDPTENFEIVLNSIPSAAVFGILKFIVGNVQVFPSSISSLESINPLLISTLGDAVLHPSTVPPYEAFSDIAIVPGLVRVFPISINSGEFLSNIVFQQSQITTVNVDVINSAEIFGNISLFKGNSVQLDVISPQESVSSILTLSTSKPASINSSEGIGDLEIFHLESTLFLSATEQGSSSILIEWSDIDAPGIYPGGIGTAEFIGQPVFSFGQVNLVTQSVSSSEFIEVPVILTDEVRIFPDSLASQENVSQLDIRIGAVLPSSISTSESVTGVNVRQISITQSTNSSESVQNVKTVYILKPNSVLSAESISQHELKGGQVMIQPSSVNSAESFNGITLQTGQITVSSGTIASAEFIGSPTISRGQVNIASNSISSVESVEQPTIVQLTNGLTFGTNRVVFGGNRVTYNE